MGEEIPKAIVEEFPDGTKPAKSKSIFKSKTHFFAALGAIVAFFPAAETWMADNPKAVMLGVYLLATTLRSITSEKVHLFKGADNEHS